MTGVPVIHVQVDGDTLNVTSETEAVIVDLAGVTVHFHGTDADLALLAGRLMRAAGAS